MSSDAELDLVRDQILDIKEKIEEIQDKLSEISYILEI